MADKDIKLRQHLLMSKSDVGRFKEYDENKDGKLH